MRDFNDTRTIFVKAERDLQKKNYICNAIYIFLFNNNPQRQDYFIYIFMKIYNALILAKSQFKNSLFLYTSSLINFQKKKKSSRSRHYNVYFLFYMYKLIYCGLFLLCATYIILSPWCCGRMENSTSQQQQQQRGKTLTPFRIHHQQSRR